MLGNVDYWRSRFLNHFGEIAISPHERADRSDDFHGDHSLPSAGLDLVVFEVNRSEAAPQVLQVADSINVGILHLVGLDQGGLAANTHEVLPLLLPVGLHFYHATPGNQRNRDKLATQHLSADVCHYRNTMELCRGAA